MMKIRLGISLLSHFLQGNTLELFRRDEIDRCDTKAEGRFLFQTFAQLACRRDFGAMVSVVLVLPLFTLEMSRASS